MQMRLALQSQKLCQTFTITTCICLSAGSGGTFVNMCLGYRWDEMLFSVFVMLVQVVLEAYILGTLFHYVVKKDAKLEEFR